MRAVSPPDDGTMDETISLRNLLPKEEPPLPLQVQASIWAIRACNVVNYAFRVFQAASQ